MTIPQIFWKTYQIDYLLLNTETNRRWFSGFPSSYGFILVNAQTGKAQYFLDDRYSEEAKKFVQNCEIRPLKDFADNWKSLQGSVGCEKDLNWMNAEQLKKINPKVALRLVNMQELRMEKTPAEIEKIEFICQITHKVWTEVEPKIRQKHTENDVKMMLIQAFLNHGIGEMAFDPIVAAGARSSFIHTQPTDQKITSHVLCDFGGAFAGYKSDFTRVKVFDSRHAINQNLHLIKELQSQILAMIRPGVLIGDITELAANFYKKHQKIEQHALGHGIGLEVHELPVVGGNGKVRLRENMVLAIEPGIYEKIGGVRIEDTVLVTKNGCRVLTQSQ